MAISTSAANGAPSDSLTQIGEALDRVLAQGFADSSERQRNLLRYLVNEELAGRGDRLKAYSIATDVFGRAADFDAQQDSIVRVEIGRLRKSLELYYATAGRLDRLRIVVEKGRYRPTFEIRDEMDEDTVAAPRFGDGFVRWLAAGLLVVAIAGGAGFWFAGSKKQAMRQGPRVAVAPFAFSSDRSGQDYIGSGLRADLMSTLSEFGWLTVFPIARAVDVVAGDKPANWKIDFLVKANIQISGDAMIVTPVLLDGATGAVRWSGRYETPFHANDVTAMQRQIATRIAADVGQPFGAVANIEQTRLPLDTFDGAEAYRCHLRTLQFWTTYRRDDFDSAMNCAGKLAGAPSAGPNLRAMLALLKLDAARFGFDRRPAEQVVAEAQDIAADAYRRDEKAALPRTARYSAALCAGELDAFRRIGLAATRDYPNNPAVLVDVGSKLALGGGDWQEGLDLVERARALSSNLPAWFDIAGVVDALRRHAPAPAGDLHAAAIESQQPQLLLVDLAVQGEAGQTAAVQAALARLSALGYDSADSILKLLDSQCWSQAVKDMLRERLAGAARKP